MLTALKLSQDITNQHLAKITESQRFPLRDCILTTPSVRNFYLHPPDGAGDSLPVFSIA